MKISKKKVLLIVFIILFILSIIGDVLIFYDFFDPCRTYMDGCSKSFTFNLVHSKYFLKCLAIENLFNIIISTFITQLSIKKKKYIWIILGIISIFSTFSLWLLLMGEVGLIFS